MESQEVATTWMQRVADRIDKRFPIVSLNMDTVRISHSEGMLRIIDCGISQESRVMMVSLEALAGFEENGRVYLPSGTTEKQWAWYFNLMLQALTNWKYDPGQASFTKMLEGYNPQEDDFQRLERLATMSYGYGYYVGMVASRIQWYKSETHYYEFTPHFASATLLVNIKGIREFTIPYVFEPDDVIGYISVCHTILAQYDPAMLTLRRK